jgi:hypothetical protein
VIANALRLLIRAAQRAQSQIRDNLSSFLPLPMLFL